MQPEIQDLQSPSLLSEFRSLAGLLPCGVLLLDGAGALIFANPRACRLMNARDEGALRQRWSGALPELGLEGLASRRLRAEPRLVPFEVAVDGERRRLQLEMHAIDASEGAHYLVLMRDRDRLAPAEDALLSASRGQTNPHVLSGMLHELSGPLNNFNLTLALLENMLGRLDPGQAPDTLARCKHYVEVLKKESGRFAYWAQEIRAMTNPPPSLEGPFDLSELARQVRRVLRHDATLNEIEIDLALPSGAAFATGDPELVRLALLNIVLCMIEATTPGGRIEVAVNAAARATFAVRIKSSAGTLPEDIAKTFNRLLIVPDAAFIGLVAGHLIADAQRGAVSLSDPADGSLAIELRLPAMSS